MSNAFSLFRALLIYGICLPLAVFLGYLLATPDDQISDLLVGVVVVALMIPLFLRWHHPLLALTWNLSAMALFLNGHPPIFFPVCAVSFGICVLQYILNRQLRFLHAPMITWPLLALLAVVLFTGQLTGGIGLRMAGSSNFGGKRYFFIMLAVAGYFALTSKRVPVERAPFYVKLFFLGYLSSAVGHLAGIISPSLNFIFMIFPGDGSGFASLSNDVIADTAPAINRLGGLATAASGIVMCLLAFYGIRGLFDPRKLWRILLFGFCAVLTVFGGFRGMLITLLLILAVQFYLEGLFRSRLLPAVLLGIVLGGAMLLPYTDRMPLAIQRTVSFLPVKIDPLAEQSARGSTEWRLMMWRQVLPEVPDHLLLGKGYSLSGAELDAMSAAISHGAAIDPYEGAALAGDYHSGPLSVVLTFGAWGAITFLWFIYASIKALYLNYTYGEPELKKINTVLLTVFVTKTITFLLVFGSLYSDLVGFTGLIGMSVCLNGGVRVPVPAPVVKQVFNRFKLAGATR